MRFIYTFKFYENIVVSDEKELYQLEHFKNKRTFPFKKLTYNKERKAYRIYSQWVSKKRLYKLILPFYLVIEDEMSSLDRILKELDIAISNKNTEINKKESV